MRKSLKPSQPSRLSTVTFPSQEELDQAAATSTTGAQAAVGDSSPSALARANEAARELAFMESLKGLHSPAKSPKRSFEAGSPLAAIPEDDQLPTPNPASGAQATSAAASTELSASR